MGEDVRHVIANTITRPNNVTQYAAGEVLSDDTDDDYFTFTQCLNETVRTGEIVQAKLTVNQGTTGPLLELFLFHTAIATTADNAANAISDAEMATLIGIISFPAAGFVNGAGNQMQILTDLHIRIPFLNGTRQICCQPVLRDNYTPVAQEVWTATLSIRQN